MQETTAQDQVEARIREVIESDVRPFIEMDGGAIQFVKYDDNIVYVQLSGACTGCPASTLTLKGGVERTIRRRIPEVRGVEMADTSGCGLEPEKSIMNIGEIEL